MKGVVAFACGKGAARRARQLQSGALPLMATKSMKACRVAQDEINQGCVTYVVAHKPEIVLAGATNHPNRSDWSSAAIGPAFASPSATRAITHPRSDGFHSPEGTSVNSCSIRCCSIAIGSNAEG